MRVEESENKGTELRLFYTNIDELFGNGKEAVSIHRVGESKPDVIGIYLRPNSEDVKSLVALPEGCARSRGGGGLTLLVRETIRLQEVMVNNRPFNQYMLEKMTTEEISNNPVGQPSTKRKKRSFFMNFFRERSERCKKLQK